MAIPTMTAMALMMAMGTQEQRDITMLDILDKPEVIQAMKTAWVKAVGGPMGIEAHSAWMGVFPTTRFLPSLSRMGSGRKQYRSNPVRQDVYHAR